MIPLILFFVSLSEKIMWCPNVEISPRIDGLLNDSIWQKAVRVSDFTQVYPETTCNPVSKTICLIVRDAENIYFGFECFISEPIIANNMVRDKFSGEEKINILFDPNNDQNTAYALFVSPLNTQIDVKLMNNGEKMLDWDGIWESNAQRFENGWTCEIRVPFGLFKEGGGKKFWGIEITRETYIKGRQTLIRWAKPSYELLRPSDFGRIYFVEEIPLSGTISSIPYGLLQKVYISDSTSKIKYTLGSDFNLSPFPKIDFYITLNPDYSQIEADPDEFDLSKTIRHLPEKREFFLNSYGNVGLPIKIMYTRRIEEIIGGAKAKIRYKKSAMEVWYVLTDSTEKSPQLNYTCVIFNQYFLKNSNFRTMFLNKYHTDSYDNNCGFELYQPLLKDFSFTSQLAFDGIKQQNNKAYYFGITRNVCEGVNSLLYYKMIDSLFNPPLGFIPFTNIHEFYGNISWTEIINYKLMQRYMVGLSYLQRSTLSSVLVNQNISPSVTLVFEKPVSIGYIFSKEKRAIMLEMYQNATHCFTFNVNEGRKYSIGISYLFGKYFGQRLDFVSLNLGNLNFKNTIIFELCGQSQKLSQNNLSTNEQIVNLKVNYNIYRNFFLRCFAEYSDLSKTARVNFLFDYNYALGSHVYLILNDEHEKANSINITDFRKRVLYIKIFHYLKF